MLRLIEYVDDHGASAGLRERRLEEAIHLVDISAVQVERATTGGTWRDKWLTLRRSNISRNCSTELFAHVLSIETARKSITIIGSTITLPGRHMHAEGGFDV